MISQLENGQTAFGPPKQTYKCRQSWRPIASTAIGADFHSGLHLGLTSGRGSFFSESKKTAKWTFGLPLILLTSITSSMSMLISQLCLLERVFNWRGYWSCADLCARTGCVDRPAGSLRGLCLELNIWMRYTTSCYSGCVVHVHWISMSQIYWRSLSICHKSTDVAFRRVREQCACGSACFPAPYRFLLLLDKTSSFAFNVSLSLGWALVGDPPTFTRLLSHQARLGWLYILQS